ncbi:MAG: TRAP transporter large permease [Deltaproteobacteria bacterium]|nr:MAG: TRAP transporter large permease [Deltaproteobacteria bacterium]
MSPEIIGVIGLIVLFVFVFARMPIALSLSFVGFLGLAWLSGIKGTLYQIGMVPYTSTAHYAFCVVPLFILMGHYAFISGLTNDAYDFAHALLGRLPGGLAMSTIGASAGFAACTGSSLASAATMTKVALPEMRRYEYDPKLATGSIAAGGTLGILIPPSAGMIYYALITDTSIGKLFIAGIFSGILLSCLFILTIYIVVRIKPEKGPPGPKASWRNVLNAFKGIWSAVILSALVMGGIWGGVFSPTEAGGIGSFAAFLIVLMKRGFIKEELIKGLWETVRTTSMIFLILIGATIFGYFITASHLPEVTVGFIEHLALPPLVILIIILLILVFLGCVMDIPTITFVMVPIFFPIIRALGFDPVWFGILFTINSEMALITPPIGMNVFVVAGVVEDIPVYEIFKGIVPFVVAMAICTALIIAFPQIALFLPNTMLK